MHAFVCYMYYTLQHTTLHTAADNHHTQTTHTTHKYPTTRTSTPQHTNNPDKTHLLHDGGARCQCQATKGQLFNACAAFCTVTNTFCTMTVAFSAATVVVVMVMVCMYSTIMMMLTMMMLTMMLTMMVVHALTLDWSGKFLCFTACCVNTTTPVCECVGVCVCGCMCVVCGCCVKT